MKTFGKVIAIICGVFVLMVGALQIVLNMPFVSRKVSEIAAANIDGDLSYSQMDFSFVKSFPNIRVTVDSLSLTYPHDRFARYDRTPVRNSLLNAGRGETADTLLRFDRFTAAVNPWHLIAGRARLSDAHLHGAVVYAHRYDTTANWQIFKSSGVKEVKDDESGPSLPWLSVRKLSIARNPRIVYTDDFGRVYAAARLKDLHLEGDVKIHAQTKEIHYKNISLDVDSLRLLANLPPDDYDVSLDRFSVSNPLHHVLDVALEADARARMKKYGELEAPVRLDARVGYNALPSVTKIVVPKLDAEVAYVPLEANGFVHLLRDSVKLKLNAAVKDCNLGKVAMTYGPNFVDILKGMPVKGRLDAGLNAEGYLARNVKPDVDATVDLDAAAPGVSIDLAGKAKDLLGRDPFFDVHAKCLAVLDSLARFVPESAGIDAAGDVDLKIDAKANMSELNTYKFNHADITGRLLSDRIRFEMPSDTLKAVTHNAEIHLKSNPDGLDVTADFDSVFFNKGDALRARTREMKNSFRMYKVEDRGQMTPRLAFVTSNRSVFVKASDNRIGLTGVNVGAAIQKRVRPQRHAPSDTLSRHGRMPRRERKVEDDELAGGDVSISLDSTITKYLRQWEPYGTISARRGFFSSPSIPLRTRLSAIDGKFTGNDIDLDTLNVKIGTSDLAAKGRVSGIRRALRRRGTIKADLDLNSQRLNVNEIIVALNKGKTVSDRNPDSESEGSFVVDSIAGADASKEKMSLIIVPGNVDASLGIKAARVDYSDIMVTPFSADLRMKDRTLQLTNADALTNLGGAHLDAFYSTKSKSDISAGLGLKLRDVSAQGIIHLLPSVDEMMPALKSFEGNLGLDLSATTQIDTNMNVIIPTLDGILRISGTDLYVRDAGDLKKITRLLLFRDKNIGQIQNLSVDAVVHDSKLEVFPFELAVDRYKLALRGMQGLDGRMNYHVSVMKSPFLIPFGINIFGYTDNWRFSLGLAKYREGKVPAYTEQLDTMQVNIVKSIRDIYRKGVSNVREQAVKRPDAAGVDAHPADSFDVESLQQLDDLSYDMAAALAEEELDAEIEAALSENVIDLDKLLREYEALNENKNIERRINKLKK